MKLSRPYSFTTPWVARHGSSYQSRRFHARTARWADAGNHYEVLGLQHDASQGDIKKQFYSLSKAHHPDHNPDDPQASERFVKISEAYTVLGSPEKRERYDRDFQRNRNPYMRTAATGTPQGSHSSSSASSPFGARSPSGLSRRRTQFKGPPPSFYRSGGWGSQADKRRAQAEASTSSSSSSSSSTGGFNANAGGGAGGMGPGQSPTGFYNDVPHFDHDAHHRTQEQQEQRKRRRTGGEPTMYDDGGSTFVQFIIVLAIVVFASAPFVTERPDRRLSRKDRDDKGVF